ncbi:extracellular solute-binding protein [Paenibacillus sp. IB182496]|uniref:Extracellular solute-binding protein n=2 Tax=Paenibacillus sabuli TaxID=2772509 RepID=A0A927BPI4_9BACL|nr:extracellular solute-binding protein [Paenibacillus sabuli]
MKTLTSRSMLLLAAAALVLALLAGCSGGDNASGTNDGAASGDSDGNTGAAGNGEAADVEYPAQITYWTTIVDHIKGSVTSLNEVSLYQELERITGTKVDFKHPSGEGEQVTEQLNLMIASQNLPDVVETNWLTIPRGPENAIQEGTILRLNELIEQHAPNFRKYLDEHPEVEKMIKTDEGSIYGFPFIRGDEQLMVFNGPIIRKDWLEAVGKEMPTTIDEWEDVLTAFRDDDPNGNGQQDEIPFFVKYDGNVKSPGLNNFIGSFGIAAQFYQVDGKVQYGEIQPEFKEFLTVLSRWYEEGLLDPDFAATDGSLKDAKVTGNQLGAFYGYAGSGIGRYTGLMEKDYPEAELYPTPYASLEKGKVAPLGQRDSAYSGGYTAAITGKAKNPEQIVKWLDFAYSEEGHMLFNFGKEGVSYEMIDGYPTYTETIMNNPDGLNVSQAMSMHFRSAYGGPFIQDKRYIEQYMQMDAQKEAVKIWSEPENKIQMPPVTMTAEENQQFASIMTDLNTYSDEMVTKFIMGVEPLTSFDQYVETLKGMGIEQAIQIQQAALDRYNQR